MATPDPAGTEAEHNLKRLSFGDVRRAVSLHIFNSLARIDKRFRLIDPGRLEVDAGVSY